MRHPRLKMAGEPALRKLAEAPVHHLATTRPDGTPVLRALQGVVLGEWLLFHSAKAGEKSQCLGRPAVVSAEQTVASIPSYFVDPRNACPATTLYVNAQATGLLQDVTDLERKAEFLRALMIKYQPEGGYAPRVRTVMLGTADRQRFYEHFGFRDVTTVPQPFQTTHMVRTGQ